MKKVQEEQLENQDIEIRLLVEAIFQKYGYDFRNYSQAHVKRRIINRFNLSGMKHLTDLIHESIYNHKFVEQLLMDLSITVTEWPRLVAVMAHSIPAGPAPTTMIRFLTAAEVM